MEGFQLFGAWPQVRSCSIPDFRTDIPYKAVVRLLDHRYPGDVPVAAARLRCTSTGGEGFRVVGSLMRRSGGMNRCGGGRENRQRRQG